MKRKKKLKQTDAVHLVIFLNGIISHTPKWQERGHCDYDDQINPIRLDLHGSQQLCQLSLPLGFLPYEG
jgi:hypothetical protein